MRDVWNLGFFRRFKRVPDASPATEAAVEDAHRNELAIETLAVFDQLAASAAKIGKVPLTRKRGKVNAR